MVATGENEGDGAHAKPECPRRASAQPPRRPLVRRRLHGDHVILLGAVVVALKAYAL
jgi:hypothetical protein